MSVQLQVRHEHAWILNNHSSITIKNQTYVYLKFLTGNGFSYKLLKLWHFVMTHTTRSPVLNPVSLYICGVDKKMVYWKKVETWDALLRWIMDASADKRDNHNKLMRATRVTNRQARCVLRLRVDIWNNYCKFMNKIFTINLWWPFWLNLCIFMCCVHTIKWGDFVMLYTCTDILFCAVIIHILITIW
jgi:hypothetical protein